MDQDLYEVLHKMRYQHRQIIARFGGTTCRFFWNDTRKMGSYYTLKERGVLDLEECWSGGKKIGIWVGLTEFGKQLWKHLKNPSEQLEDEEE